MSIFSCACLFDNAGITNSFLGAAVYLIHSFLTSFIYLSHTVMLKPKPNQPDPITPVTHKMSVNLVFRACPNPKNVMLYSFNSILGLGLSGTLPEPSPALSFTPFFLLLIALSCCFCLSIPFNLFNHRVRKIKGGE